MPHQQDLFPTEAPNQAPTNPAPNIREPREAVHEAPHSPLWLQRLSMVILVVFCFYIGLLMILLPWTRYWNDNHFLLTWPIAGRLLTGGFARGVISGVGLLDWWIGISEVIHYREYRHQ